MSDVFTLSQERNQLFSDLFEGRVPKRVPISINTFPIEFSIQYAGENLVDFQWDTTDIVKVLDKTCRDFISDSLPVYVIRFPVVYKTLGAKNFVMGSNGYLQHPEVEGMLVEDYNDFIASPLNCIMEKILPRIYTELVNPVTKGMALAKGFKAFYDEKANADNAYEKLIEKYGFASNVNTFSAFTEAPFDFVADQLRGFKGIVADLRRVPEKLEAAAEAVTPLMVKNGLPVKKSQYGSTFIPLHMAPYLREKDFERFYWPSFKKLIEGLAEAGQPAFLFVEHDWMRYLDYLYELPENTRMRFEFGDPKLVKEKLGKKHIISGFYPISLLKTGTKEQCIDKAKELIDILAPGGRFFFDFDKIPITLDSVNSDNTKAVLEYVATKANY